MCVLLLPQNILLNKLDQLEVQSIAAYNQLGSSDNFSLHTSATQFFRLYIYIYIYDQTYWTYFSVFEDDRDTHSLPLIKQFVAKLRM